MKDKVLMLHGSSIDDIIYTCPKCSKMSLVKIGPDLYHCPECKPLEKNASESSDNFAMFLLGLIGWFALLLLL